MYIYIDRHTCVRQGMTITSSRSQTREFLSQFLVIGQEILKCELLIVDYGLLTMDYQIPLNPILASICCSILVELD